MVKVFEILEQILINSYPAIANVPGDGLELTLTKKAAAEGFRKMASDLHRLRELAKSPRITSWMECRRATQYRDSGATSTIVELLDLLRSMA